jgi:GntR family transcriptional regulator
MADAVLTRSDAIPLYHQLFLSLRDEIISGMRAPGSAMPTEHKLAEIFSVSRITARRALDELAHQGFVERRRRTGTRVIYQGAMKPIEASLDQTVDALLSFGKGTDVRVLDLAEVAAPREAAEALHLAPGASVVRAVRLRVMQGEPLGQIVSHIPATVARGQIDRAALQSKPILSIIRDLGYDIVEGRQTVQALSADPVLAATLGLEPRAAILQVERVVIGQSGAPILHTVANYRADRYRLSLDLRGSAIEVEFGASSKSGKP